MKRPRAKEMASDYQLKGVTLGKASSTPYLGVSISENLEWGDHIYIQNCELGEFHTGFLEEKFKGIAYFSMVQSLLEYSCPVY